MVGPRRGGRRSAPRRQVHVPLYQLCHSWRSTPLANTSSRPGAQLVAAGAPSMLPPSDSTPTSHHRQTTGATTDRRCPSRTRRLAQPTNCQPPAQHPTHHRSGSHPRHTPSYPRCHTDHRAPWRTHPTDLASNWPPPAHRRCGHQATPTPTSHHRQTTGATTDRRCPSRTHRGAQPTNSPLQGRHPTGRRAVPTPTSHRHANGATTDHRHPGRTHPTGPAPNSPPQAARPTCPPATPTPGPATLIPAVPQLTIRTRDEHIQPPRRPTRHSRPTIEHPAQRLPASGNHMLNHVDFRFQSTRNCSPERWTPPPAPVIRTVAARRPPSPGVWLVTVTDKSLPTSYRAATSPTLRLTVQLRWGLAAPRRRPRRSRPGRFRLR